MERYLKSKRRGEVKICNNPACKELIEKWVPWWREKNRSPVAIMKCSNYDEKIGAKGRNMVKKANRLYDFRIFNYNDYLDDMYEVNISKETRSGGPMTEAYKTKPTPVAEREYCGDHDIQWWGAFSDDKLVAYVQLIKLNRFGIVNKALGHAEAPAAMNGLFDAIAKSGSYGFIHYLTLSSSPPGLRAFKESVGFEEIGGL